jgi:hypothetical protein
MSLFNFNVVPNNLLGSTSNLINQPSTQNRLLNNIPYTSSQLSSQEDMDYSLLSGGKKEKKKPKLKKEKKVKLIDTFLKSDLEKIAKNTTFL